MHVLKVARSSKLTVTETLYTRILWKRWENSPLNNHSVICSVGYIDM